MDGTLFSKLHIDYAHLDSVRFENSVCHGSLIYIYDHLYIFNFVGDTSLLKNTAKEVSCKAQI